MNTTAIAFCTAQPGGGVPFHPFTCFDTATLAGLACGQTVLSLMKKELNLSPGETSPDYEYTLDTVACLGACFLAPTMMVGKEYVGKLTPAKVGSVLDHYKTGKKGDE